MDLNQWQTFLKSCLDILRNGRSKFDGLKAINEFLTLITLKLVEHRIRDIVDNDMKSDTRICIGSDCKITYLYDIYCQPIRWRRETILQTFWILWRWIFYVEKYWYTRVCKLSIYYTKKSINIYMLLMVLCAISVALYLCRNQVIGFLAT